jgi:hypothetical protein
MRKSVCILYGFGEGEAIGRRFVSRLKGNGFEITKDASQADIIIAHSGGILDIPLIYKAKTFLLVGVNDKIDGPIIQTQIKKVKQDFVYAIRSKQHLIWLRKSFWNTYYILSEIKRTRQMLQIGRKGGPFIPHLKNAEVIVINYKDDPWSDSLTKKDLEKFPHYKLITHSGLHDDLWQNPDYYISWLKSIA